MANYLAWIPFRQRELFLWISEEQWAHANLQEKQKGGANDEALQIKLGEQNDKTESEKLQHVAS